MALKHYVSFLSPGSFFPNEKHLEIESRTAHFEVPKNCFAYYFFDREEVEKDGELLVGSEKNKSGRFYFGQVMTAADVEREVTDNEILLSNMSNNNWDVIIKTRMGNFQPLGKDDTVLSEKD